jgi:hypothetical protein
MTKKLFRRIFPLIAFLLLAPWPVAYTVSFSSDTVAQNGIQVSTAEVSAAPTWNAVEKTIGGVTPGDLFFIDATDTGADIQATLHFTNASELVDSYRYLILKVGLSVDNGSGEWEPAYGTDGELAPDTFISLRNGYTDFTLPGYAKYKVTIDSGSFYCTDAGIGGGSTSPQFYLMVN